MSEGWQFAITSIGGFGALVTAVATVMLWWVTATLARATKGMVEAASQPHVVATIEPSRWAITYADLHLANTGNATAYEIEVGFTPPLQRDEAHSNDPMPLQGLSVLKPGQSVSSSLGRIIPLLEVPYDVTVSWKRKPGNHPREVNSYTLDLSLLKGLRQLGAADPLIQIAEEVKKLREDWQYVARGSRRLENDVFLHADRTREQRELELRWDAEDRAAAARPKKAPKSRGKAE